MAARYLVAGGTGNWNSTTNWSATDGGASGASFPVAGDDVILNTNSANAPITVNVASACATISVSNYTGTWTQTSTITTTGNVTWGSGMVFAGTGNWVWNGSGTHTYNGKTYPGGITVNGAGMTITMGDDGRVAGNITHTTTGTTLTINSNKLYCAGNYTATSGRLLVGTAELILNTSSSQTLSVSGSIACNLTFAASGTIVISNLTFLTGTMKYTSGTMSIGTAILSLTGSCTLDTNGVSWYDISFVGASQTYTINSLLTVTNNFTNLVTTSFSGTAGWTVANLIFTSAAKTFTFKNGNTYTVTNSMTLTGTAASNIVFVSASPGSTYNFVLSGGATQDIGYINCTDAVSSAGQTIWAYKATLSNTTNWRQLTNPMTLSYAN